MPDGMNAAPALKRKPQVKHPEPVSITALARYNEATDRADDAISLTAVPATQIDREDQEVANDTWLCRGEGIRRLITAMPARTLQDARHQIAAALVLIHPMMGSDDHADLMQLERITIRTLASVHAVLMQATNDPETTHDTTAARRWQAEFGLLEDRMTGDAA